MSPSTRVTASSSLAAVVVLLSAYAARGQETLEQRYQRALELFNKPDMESACELLRAIDRESPDYRETKRYLNPACAAMHRLQANEEKLYTAGVQLFSQENYDDAAQQFEQAQKIETQLNHPKYTREIDDYLKKIEDRKFQRCADAYGRQKPDEAKACFTQLIQAGGRRATQARQYLAEIADDVRATQLLNDGIRLSKEGKYADARADFERVVRKGGPQSSSARTLLAQLDRRAQDRASKLPAGIQETRQTTSPAASSPPAADQELREGLQAYFEGNFADAERRLTGYMSSNGSKQNLAHFFLGATDCARYYLSGEKDSLQKAKALENFRAVKQNSQNFQPPEKYTSPKILALYNEAINSPAP